MNPRFRIASLCPSNTEILCALGLGEYLVGVDLYSDYPPSVVNTLPRLGPDLNIDIDKLIRLKPDITVCSLSVPGMEKVVDEVRSAGLQHIVLSPHSFDDIFSDMYEMAKLCEPYVTGDYEQTIEDLRGRVSTVRTATANQNGTPTVYWEWWPSPIFSPAKNNWLTELSDIAGLRNIFGHIEGDQIQDNGDKVLEANPDFMFLVWTGVPQERVPLRKVLNRPKWTSVMAVQRQCLYVLSEGLYCRPSPRLVDGLEQIVSLIYPDIAEDLGLHPPTTYGPIRSLAEFLASK